jgi:hypothetical protein
MTRPGIHGRGARSPRSHSASAAARSPSRSGCRLGGRDSRLDAEKGWRRHDRVLASLGAGGSTSPATRSAAGRPRATSRPSPSSPSPATRGWGLRIGSCTSRPLPRRQGSGRLRAWQPGLRPRPSSRFRVVRLDATGIRTRTPRVNQRGDGTRQIVTEALRCKRVPSTGCGPQWTRGGRVETFAGGKMSGTLQASPGPYGSTNRPSPKYSLTRVDSGDQRWHGIPRELEDEGRRTRRRYTLRSASKQQPPRSPGQPRLGCSTGRGRPAGPERTRRASEVLPCQRTSVPGSGQDTKISRRISSS